MYITKIAISEPETGPAIDEVGIPVRVLIVNDDSEWLVETIEEYEDPGNGENEPTLERAVFWIERENLEKVEAPFF